MDGANSWPTAESDLTLFDFFFFGVGSTKAKLPLAYHEAYVGVDIQLHALKTSHTICRCVVSFMP